MTRSTSKPPSAAQNKARARNWRIRNLRALWSQVGQLRADRAEQARSLIDNEIADLGAEPERARRVRFVTETDIPF